MAFLKGARENPSQVVTTGETQRGGKAPVAVKEAADGAKGLIYGDEEKPTGRPWRPTPQQQARVDVTTGPPPELIRSKVGNLRERRGPNPEEQEKMRKFQEDSAQAYLDARCANQSNKTGQAVRGSPLKDEQRTQRPSVSREKPHSAQTVDPELTAMFAGIEETAALQRMNVDEAADPYWDARTAAAQQRTRNRGEGIFPEAAPESPAAHERITPKARAAAAEAPFIDAQAATNFADAKMAREQAMGRNRRSENVICGGYVSEEKDKKQAAFTHEEAASNFADAKLSREQAMGRNRRSENVICGEDVPGLMQRKQAAFTNDQAATNFADAKMAREQAMAKARNEGIFADAPRQKTPPPRGPSTNIISHDGAAPKARAPRGPTNDIISWN